jgi:hypothetical protein
MHAWEENNENHLNCLKKGEGEIRKSNGVNLIKSILYAFMEISQGNLFVQLIYAN